MRLAATLVHDPEILVLDEPLNGADPRQRLHFKQLLETLLAEGRTIILTTSRTAISSINSAWSACQAR